MKKAIPLLLLLFVASAMAFEDDKESDKHYCNMVESGYWSDYNKGIDCSDVKGYDE
jgi:hypothetical protein